MQGTATTPSTEVWPANIRLEWLDRVDSTSSEALRRAAAGEAGPLWIAAHEQSQGRGRHSRIWRSSAKDLKASLLLTPGAYRRGAALSEIASLSLLASLALAEALERLAPRLSLSLKWPNDLLADERKIAGILVENHGEQTVIGVGVNLTTCPPAAALEPDAWPAAAVAELLGAAPNPEALLGELAAQLERRLIEWGAGGFAAIRPDWLARAARLGGALRLRIADQRLEGVFADIDASGALLLDTAEGRRMIHAADVFFADPTRERD